MDLTSIEKAPQSKPSHDVLIEDLTNSGIATDADFQPLAKRLVDASAAEMRKAGPQTGVQLRAFEAASLRINDPDEHPDEVRTLLPEVASREFSDVPVCLLALSTGAVSP
jgi:hypothetical protein